MAAPLTFATRTSAGGVEPQTPVIRGKRQTQECPAQSSQSPRQDLSLSACWVTSRSPNYSSKHQISLLVAVLQESHPVPDTLRHSYIHSFIQHVPPSTTGPFKLALPVLGDAPSGALQSTPAQVGAVPAEVPGPYPSPILCLGRPVSREGGSWPKNR